MLMLLAIFSLGAFLFVNLKSNQTLQNTLMPLPRVSEQTETQESEEQSNATLPISIFGKALALAEKFLSTTH